MVAIKKNSKQHYTKCDEFYLDYVHADKCYCNNNFKNNDHTEFMSVIPSYNIFNTLLMYDDQKV